MSDTEITVDLDEYMKLKNSYDEYQSKQYRIDFSVHKFLVIDEDGTQTEIKRLHTNSFNFPDNTVTQLSELYDEVNENCEYVEYVEKKLARCKEANKIIFSII